MIRNQIIYQPKENIKIQYNWQYDVMKNLYYYLSIADEILSRRLHSKGYRIEDGHIFKLINYTLLFENAKFTKNEILCNKNTKLKLIITGRKKIIEKILKGIIHIKKIKINNFEIQLQNIKKDKKVFFKPIMLYKSFSPIIESTKNNDNNTIYLSPYEPDYYKNLAENAKRKYKLIYNKDYKGKIFFDIDNALNIKEKYIRIKFGGVKGYSYCIWIEANKDMQKILYYLGLGQNSSTGCGCLNFITGCDKDE